MNIFKNIYRSTRNFLSKHKLLSLIMSHGGMHLLVLIALVVAIVIMSINLSISSKRVMLVQSISLKDTCDHYAVTDLKLKLTPVEPEESTNVTHKVSVFAKFGFKDFKLSNQSQTFTYERLIENSIDVMVRCTKDLLAEYFIFPDSLEDEDVIRDYIMDKISQVTDSLSKFHALDEYVRLSEVNKISSSFLKKGFNINEVEIPENLSKVIRLDYSRNTFLSESELISASNPSAIHDTIETDKFKIIKGRNQYSLIYKKVNKVSKHKFYIEPFTYGTDIRQKYINSGNLTESPYLDLSLKFDIEFDKLDEFSYIDIDLNHPNSDIIYNLTTVIPEPSFIGINHIRYEGRELVERVLKEGQIIISGEDIGKAYKKEREFIVISVLLGTLIAFALDVFIQLIYKWRRL